MSMNGIDSLLERDLAPGDIARLVQALLAGIARGELEATAREIEFLNSIEDMLSIRDQAEPSPR